MYCILFLYFMRLTTSMLVVSGCVRVCASYCELDSFIFIEDILRLGSDENDLLSHKRFVLAINAYHSYPLNRCLIIKNAKATFFGSESQQAFFIVSIHFIVIF